MGFLLCCPPLQNPELSSHQVTQLAVLGQCQCAQMPVPTTQWFCTEAFVCRELNIAADPSQATAPLLATCTGGSVRVMLYGKG